MHFITRATNYVSTFRVELLLGFCAVISTALLVVAARGQHTAGEYIGSDRQDNVNKIIEEEIAAGGEAADKKIIAVEISGAVYKPGVYELPEGARVVALLKAGGGLNKQADQAFFARNYNLARVLKDGEKIHAPSADEIVAGAFVEAPLMIYTNELKTEAGDQGTPGQSAAATTANQSQSLANVNTAAPAALEALPGVGKVTAEKIIQNRPYTSLDDLVIKAVISQTLFDKIKNSLTL